MITSDTLAPPEMYGFLALAWRALYAELTKAHIERKRPNLQKASSRAHILTHTRLTAYGHRWETWNRKNLRTSRMSSVPLTIQTKHKFISLTVNAEYQVHPHFLAKAKAAS